MRETEEKERTVKREDKRREQRETLRDGEMGERDRDREKTETKSRRCQTTALLKMHRLKGEIKF